MENSRINPDFLNLPVTISSFSPEDTFSLGLGFSSFLEKGSIVALEGKLGAGKTCFVKGIARGLRITEEVTSPTYTIISEYEGFLWEKSQKTLKPLPFYHIDAYRLSGNEDFYAIGGEEIVFGKGISVIEWCERVPEFIPPGAFRVNIEIIKATERLIRIYRTETGS